MKVPVFVPTWSLPQKARRGGVWGCVIALQTPLQFRSPAPRGLCEKSPNSVAELCVAPRRGGVGVEVRGASSQRWLCRIPLVGVGVVPCSFQRRLRGLPTPAPDWFVLARPKVALACAIGRGSPFKVVSSCRRCVLRASQRTSRETGATRAASAAQNRARQFRVKRVCSEVAALGFPPLAGVAHDPLRGTTPRTFNRPRGLRLFSRQLGSTRTLQGHPVWGARIVPRVGGL